MFSSIRSRHCPRHPPIDTRGCPLVASPQIVSAFALRETLCQKVFKEGFTWNKMRIKLDKAYLLVILLLIFQISLTLAQTDSTSGSSSGGSGGTSSSTVYDKSCTYIWDSTPYLNKEVKITASITDTIGIQDSDSVTLNVKEGITSGTGSARYMDGKTLDIQIVSPQSDVAPGAVEIKIDAKGPYELKTVGLSFVSGQGGGGFQLSDRNCLSYGSGSGGSGSTIPPSTSDSGSGGGPGAPSSTGGSGGGGAGYTAPITEGIKDKYQFFGKIGGNTADSTDYQFNLPSDVAVDSKNNIYIADERNNRVMVYDANLNFIKKFQGDFSEPRYITIDKDNNIYIVDLLYTRRDDVKYFDGARVRKFDKNGNLLFQVQGVTRSYESDGSYKFTTQELLYFAPNGIAVDSRGQIYLSEGGFDIKATIYIFDANGKFVRVLEDPRLSRPDEIAVNDKDYLYITDELTSKILIYDNNLRYASEIDKGITSIKDIEFDKERFLYLADLKGQRIEVYNKDFNYYATIGGNKAGNEDNQLFHPEGIDIGEGGKVYVTNTGNNRISIFSPVIPASESGSGIGGGPGETSTCEKYYVCQDGKEVQYCFIHKFYNEEGELAGAGCGCKSNPEILCISESTGDSGSGGGPGVIKSIPSSGSGGSNSTPLLCDGCVLGNKCVFIGYRTDDSYCDISSEFKDQKRADASCNNNFECSTNLCIDNECVSQGLWRKILSFFKRLFGGE